MSESLGYASTLEDSDGNIIFPTAYIGNIISKDGSYDTVSKGIVWNADFIVNDNAKICFISIKYENPEKIIFIPTIDYNPNYSYYVNQNQVSIKTSSTSEDEGVSWKAGVPIFAIFKNGILYINSSKNDDGIFLNNIPVNINTIQNGQLLQYLNGKIIPYMPPVKYLYQPGQIKGWNFEQYGSDIAISTSGCEDESLRVCIYGNEDDLKKGTAVCESDMINFEGYTKLILKYTNGYMNLAPIVQIINEENISNILNVPYTENVDTISFLISDMDLHNAKIQIAVSAMGTNISEINIFEIKLV